MARPQKIGQRVVTGLIAAGIVVACNFLTTSEGMLVATLVVFLGAAWELLPILRSWAPRFPAAALFVAILAETAILAAIVRGDLEADPAFLVLALGFFVLLFPGLVALRVAGEPRDLPVTMVFVAFAPAYIAIPSVAVYGLHRMDAWWCFMLIAILAFGDSFAWLFGSLWGKHKLAPSVSPKKSWEGAAAGLIGSLIPIGILSWVVFDRIDPVLMAVAAAAAAVGQVGDLVESVFKRGAGVKDSGGLLPGHGGILDRVDAFLLASPVLYGGLSLAGFGPLS